MRTLLMLVLLLTPLLCWVHPPYGIAVDPSGNIYFTDILRNGDGTIWKLSNGGEVSSLITSFHAHQLQLLPDGRLISSHGEGLQRMVAFSTNTGQTDTILTETDYKRFNGGNAWYAQDGSILFGASGHIFRYNFNGSPNQFSMERFDWNQLIFETTDGQLYAADIGNGNGRLYRLDADGRKQMIADNLIAPKGRAYDRSTDVLIGFCEFHDDILICDTGGKRIVRINPDKGESASLYESNTDWYPTGICLKGAEILMLEHRFGTRGLEGPRISCLDENMQRSTVFGFED